MSALGPQGLELVIRLSQSNGLTADTKRQSLRSFAELNGWNPSDTLLDYSLTQGFANGHILVDQGLENALVISFLKSDTPVAALQPENVRGLLSVSYNHLVDLHIVPDASGLSVFHNRAPQAKPVYLPLVTEPDAWSSTSFQRLVRAVPAAAFEQLDRTLIQTIKEWKRRLAAECQPTPSNAAVAALFNSIIFVRALEDLRLTRGTLDVPVLRAMPTVGPRVSAAATLRGALARLGFPEAPELVEDDLRQLGDFSSLPIGVWDALVGDFYVNRYAGYPLDFCLISKQALSRIYEQYVAVLREDNSPQLRLWKELPTSTTNRSLGAVYTPQFIARFFARYVRLCLSGERLRRMKAIDPACGSGVFLRSLLEAIWAAEPELSSAEFISGATARLTGIDVDPGACHATRLSLSLLHLALTESLPASLDVVNDEAIGFCNANPTRFGSYDVVIANPPFIPWDRMSREFRDHIVEFLGQKARGKTDAFLAMLELGCELVADNGFLCYLLPHSFLIADSARALRERIASEYQIHVLADLSSIDVFPGVGSYVVLLIAEKVRPETELRQATIVRCRDYVGLAFQEVLKGRELSSTYFQVFHADQSMFTGDPWVVLPPVQSQVAKRLKSLPTLGSLYEPREGMVSGRDDVFIRDSADVPKEETDVWRPLLADREMKRFVAPAKTVNRIFFPVIDGKRLTEAELRAGYGKTWRYLSRHREKAGDRPAVRAGQVEWWRPHRTPTFLDRPKIVGPHLASAPKFCLDSKGRFAVTRAPIVLAPQGPGFGSFSEQVLLLYALGILNSSVAAWQISTTSHKYARDFAMIEPKTLKKLRMPDPRLVPGALFEELVACVGGLVTSKGVPRGSRGLDAIVADVYGFSEREMEIIQPVQGVK